MVRRNYQFEKRQKDLARKKKKEEKLKRKQEKRDTQSPGDPVTEGLDNSPENALDSSEAAENSDDTKQAEAARDATKAD